MIPEEIRDMFPTLPPSPHTWNEEQSQPWPRVLFEDVSGIPFVDGVSGVEEYQHRARVRANTGDLFIAATQPAPGYEAYCQNKLGLGAPEFLHCVPEDGDVIRVARALRQGKAFEALVSFARNKPGVVLEPYMSLATVWELAQALSQSAGVEVQVVGPEPQTLWLANDKLSLARLMRKLGLESSLVETHASNDPEDVTRLLREMSSRHPLVGLKRTRCAAAMGNQVFVGADIMAEGEASTRARVDAFLLEKEWTPGEEIIIVEWAETSCSPSTQMWIPPSHTHNPPRLDGIYEQLLAGTERTFVGSRPSTLSEVVHAELRRVSEAVARAFQALGYTGRCSFDFIVVNPESPSPRVLCIECNGRWGGTSTPMHLVSRVVPGPRPAYIAKDVISDKLVGADFSDLVAMLGEEAYDVATGQGRFLLYNPGPLQKSGKVDVIAMGASPEEAREAMEVTLPTLWGI